MADLKTDGTILTTFRWRGRTPPVERIDGERPRDGQRQPPSGRDLPLRAASAEVLEAFAARLRKAIRRRNPELDVTVETINRRQVITVFNQEIQAVIRRIPAERALRIDPEQDPLEALVFDARV